MLLLVDAYDISYTSSIYQASLVSGLIKKLLLWLLIGLSLHSSEINEQAHYQPKI